MSDTTPEDPQLDEAEDTGPHSSGDDDMGAAHGDSEWIPIFVSWAREETDTLDFDGASVPQRVQDLLKHLPDA